MRIPAASILAMALLLLPGVANADEYSDFHVPDHRYLSLYSRLDGRLARETDSWLQQRRGSVDGGAGSWFDWAHRTDAFTTVVGATVTGTTIGSWSRRAASYQDLGNYTLSTVDGASQRYGAWVASLGADHSWHSGTLPVSFGASIGGTISGSLDRQKTSGTSEATGAVVGSDVSYEWTARSVRANERRIGGELHIGVGRVRIVNGVYEAHVLEQRLIETGALARALSPDTRRRLAELMYVRYAWDTVRDRSAKDLWAEVDRVLREDGALGERGLDPYSVWRGGEAVTPGSIRFAGDGLPSTPVNRQIGSQLRLEFGAEHMFAELREENGTFSQFVDDGVPGPPLFDQDLLELTNSRDDLFGGVVAAWYRPIGHRWQFDAMGRLRVPLQDGAGGHETVATGSASWIVSERWLAGVHVAGRRNLRESDDAPTVDDWLWQYGGSVGYGVTERLYALLSLIEVQESAGNSALYQRRTSLQLALNYRFVGTFRMPGFTLPVLR